MRYRAVDVLVCAAIALVVDDGTHAALSLIVTGSHLRQRRRLNDRVECSTRSRSCRRF
jgi:hypothetical protein